ncbi:MAG: MFS transporter [Chloroflexales bacterium]|nr:MFS transporter [Chloroflexales bacterium]
MRSTSLTLIIIAYIAFVSLGLPDGLLGVAWPSIRTTFTQPLSNLGLLMIALSVGFLTSSFNSGYIVSRLGVGRLLLASSVLVTISLFGYALSPAWWILVSLTALLGMGGGMIDAGINAYAAAHFNPRNVNWLHACYGLGAMLGPLVMTAMLTSGQSWRWGYALVGIVLMSMTFCFIWTRTLWEDGAPSESTDAQPKAPVAPASIGATLKHPLAWASIALFFIYTGLEVTAGQWAYALFTEGRGISPGTAGIWVSIYWGSLTLGRIAFGVAVERFTPRTILRTSMLAVLVGALLLWLNITPLLSFLGLALIGFMLAPIFPLLIAQTPARLGAAHAANAIGFQIAAANLGVSCLPALAGVLAGAIGLEVIGPFMLATGLLLLLLHEVVLRMETLQPRSVPAPVEQGHQS